jgi:hypothetical protein
MSVFILAAAISVVGTLSMIAAGVPDRLVTRTWLVLCMAWGFASSIAACIFLGWPV